MRAVYIVDVGDGLCMLIDTIFGELIQIDWGSQEGSKIAFSRLMSTLRSLDFIFGPDVFVLSHFHVDHYNGLLYASINWHKLPKFDIDEVYFPQIPEFKKRKEFLCALLTMNAKIFGSETGVMEYDFLKAVSKITRGSFHRRPLSRGDFIDINGSIFEVLWPPRVIENERVLSRVRKALRDFERAREEDEEIKQLYERVREEGIFEKYLREGEEESKEYKVRRYENVQRKRKLPEVVVKANKSLREAANHLSLALFEDNRLLFLGDVSKFEIRQIVRDLNSKDRNRFFVLITPHHGTHWHESLRRIRSVYSISSVGRQLFKKLQPYFKEISQRSLATYVNGDILVSTFPTKCFWLRMPWLPIHAIYSVF